MSSPSSQSIHSVNKDADRQQWISALLTTVAQLLFVALVIVSFDYIAQHYFPNFVTTSVLSGAPAFTILLGLVALAIGVGFLYDHLRHSQSDGTPVGALAYLVFSTITIFFLALFFTYNLPVATSIQTLSTAQTVALNASSNLTSLSASPTAIQQRLSSDAKSYQFAKLDAGFIEQVATAKTDRAVLLNYVTQAQTFGLDPSPVANHGFVTTADQDRLFHTVMSKAAKGDSRAIAWVSNHAALEH